MSDEIARFSAEQTANFLGGGELGRPQYTDPDLQAKMDAHREAMREAFSQSTNFLAAGLERLSPHTADRLRALHTEAMEGNVDAMHLYITMIAELATQALVP